MSTFFYSLHMISYPTCMIHLTLTSIFKGISAILDSQGGHFVFLRPRPNGEDANLDLYQILIYT